MVGHSLGGGIAVAIGERSDAVRALALLAPVGFGPIVVAEAMALPGVMELTQLARPFALFSPLALHDALPAAHVEVWRGMGHQRQRERPAELARFIEDHASRGAGTVSGAGAA